MLEPNSLKQLLESLFTELCKEALVKENESNPSVIFYTRSPEGKTIAEEATTISLNRQAYALLQDVVIQLREDRRWRVELSRKELEQEAVTSLFEGTKALQEGIFNAQVTVDSLLTRLAIDRETWNIYLPIEGLELPNENELILAGGVFKTLAENEKGSLQDECMKIWSQAKWQPPESADSGICTLNQHLDETLNSNIMWYQIQVNGRQKAAKNQAIDAAILAMDILTFFALLNGINPEVFASHFPHQAKRGIMKSIQIALGRGCTLHSESGIPFPYTLDSSRYRKLINLKEFQEIQMLSNSHNINPVQQRFLLGIQQYSEATRLPSLTARLVWYLSALETVLLKETEHKSKKVIKRRISKILGVTAADKLDPLYDKRVKTVHYGHRNRIGEESATNIEVDYARSLSYLGIISIVKHSSDFTEIEAFLDYIDNLPEKCAK